MIRPIREPALLDELADRVTRQFPGRARVIVDGAPPTQPAALADALVEALRLRGRPALRVSAADFLRPASVRLEHGRTDPDELLHGWLDVAGLRREVLEPAGPDGSGQVLPRLWDSRVDRAYRAQRVELAANGVVVLAGALLLGGGCRPSSPCTCGSPPPRWPAAFGVGDAQRAGVGSSVEGGHGDVLPGCIGHGVNSWPRRPRARPTPRGRLRTPREGLKPSPLLPGAYP